MKIFSIAAKMFLVGIAVVSVSGCATIKELRKNNDGQALQIQNLNSETMRLAAEIERLNKEKEDEARKRLETEEKKEELQKDVDELAQARKELEDKLQDEIKKGELIVARQAKGLVVSVVAEVLFLSSLIVAQPDTDTTAMPLVIQQHYGALICAQNLKAEPRDARQEFFQIQR